MSDYEIHELNDEITLVIDEFLGCIYLVKGTKTSLVIDTGMSYEPLKPIVEKYLGNNYSVVCTHGHLDHVGRCGEFDTMYMSSQDRFIYTHNFELGSIDDMYNMQGRCLLDISQIQNMPYYFDLGNRKIYVVDCPGHTPGSVLLVDPRNQTIFCGDAIGSGCSVWMQVDYALSIRSYQKALEMCYYNLILLGVNEDWYFLGGHWGHEFHSKVASYNLLNVHTIENMIVLTRKLLNGELPYRKIHATRFHTGQPYYTSYHKAEIIFTLEQLQ